MADGTWRLKILPDKRVELISGLLAKDGIALSEANMKLLREKENVLFMTVPTSHEYGTRVIELVQSFRAVSEPSAQSGGSLAAVPAAGLAAFAPASQVVQFQQALPAATPQQAAAVLLQQQAQAQQIAQAALASSNAVQLAAAHAGGRRASPATGAPPPKRTKTSSAAQAVLAAVSAAQPGSMLIAPQQQQQLAQQQQQPQQQQQQASLQAVAQQPLPPGLSAATAMAQAAMPVALQTQFSAVQLQSVQQLRFAREQAQALQAQAAAQGAPPPAGMKQQAVAAAAAAAAQFRGSPTMGVAGSVPSPRSHSVVSPGSPTEASAGPQQPLRAAQAQQQQQQLDPRYAALSARETALLVQLKEALVKMQRTPVKANDNIFRRYSFIVSVLEGSIPPTAKFEEFEALVAEQKLLLKRDVPPELLCRQIAASKREVLELVAQAVASVLASYDIPEAALAPVSPANSGALTPPLLQPSASPPPGTVLPPPTPPPPNVFQHMLPVQYSAAQQQTPQQTTPQQQQSGSPAQSALPAVWHAQMPVLQQQQQQQQQRYVAAATTDVDMIPAERALPP